MIMMTCFIEDAITCGASSIGRSHLIDRTPNQDHFTVKRNRYGIVMSVCDGVGSNRYSQFGSKAACKAVEKTFKLYYKHKIKKDQIGTRIEFYYKRNLNSDYREAAGTTCLFAFIYESEVVIGQAGDGLILIRIDDKMLVFKDKSDDFINEVNPLNCNKRYNEWVIKNLRFDPRKNSVLALLLCTDGISEDVIPDKREVFFDYFLKKSKSGCADLQKKLDDWDAPGSIDDKTIATFEWRK